jgi:hypothetical protein
VIKDKREQMKNINTPYTILFNTKGRLKLLFAILLFTAGLAVNVMAQTANQYSFTTSTGGAAINPTYTTIVFSGVDDGASTVRNIGFNFVYEGVTYTQVSANSNGLMRFGGTAVGTTGTNDITAASNQPKIMPLWDDLSTASNGNVRIGTTGTAPNRICVIDYRLYNSWSVDWGFNLRFQVRLYETTNVIEFCYITATSTPSASVGIGGANSANFLSVTTSNHTANNRTANNSNTTSTGAGRLYTFTPPVCSTAPTGITTAVNCPALTTTLTSAGGSSGTDAIDVWYAGGCGIEAFSENWNTQSYGGLNQTTVNSSNGVLNVTSTAGGDPFISMYSLGSFAPATYRYINVRYRVTSANAPGSMQIFFTNASTATASASWVRTRAVPGTQNVWQTVSFDMATLSGGDAGSWTSSNITGWRFDWSTAAAIVTMDIDFITLTDIPLEGTGSSITVAPASTTTYFTAKKSACGVTACTSQSVAVATCGTITTGTITGSPFCAGASVSVPFTSTGTYNAGNVYTAQLSNGTGSFASPVNIGTLSSTALSGTINATIPTNTAGGTGYRIRVVSSNTVVTGSDNGVNLTVTALPSATISYAGTPFCTSNGTAQAVTRTGTAGGTYSASPAGLTINASTGAITPSTSAANTYTVTYLVAAAGGCAAYSTTTSVTVNTAPTANAGTNLTVGRGTAAQLAGTFSGATGVSWSSSQAGTFSPNNTTANVTWIPTDPLWTGVATLTMTTTGAAGGCSNTNSQITVTVGIAGICPGQNGGSVALSGGSYEVSIDNGVTYNPYISGAAINTTGATGSVRIRATATSNGCSNSTVYTIWNIRTDCCNQPTATSTSAATGITCRTASTGGNITAAATDPCTITERGVVYGISANPTILNGKVTATGTTGSFTSSLTNLTPNTLYYIRSYAATGSGTVYGPQQSFTTSTPPSITSSTSGSSCGSGAVTISASASSGTVNWFADATGGTALATGNSYSPTVSSTTIFYAAAVSGDCETSLRTPVTATVNTIPTITGTTPNARCGIGTVVLGATASAGTINWYAASTSGASLGTGTSFTTPSISATTSYWVDATANGCTTGTRTQVTATVNTIPTITGTTSNSRCGTGTVALGATASAGTINWYAASISGASLGTGTTFTTPSISATTSYWVDATANGCTSPSRIEVVATVNGIPATPTANNNARCGTGAVTLSINSLAGGTVRWFSDAGLTNQVASMPTDASGITPWTTPSLSTTTNYYVTRTTAAGCTSGAVTVTATINAFPSAPIVGTITPPSCGSSTGSVALSGLPASGTWTLTRSPGGVNTTGTGTSTTVSGIPGGASYTFTVTSAAVCTSTASGNVAMPGSPAIPSLPVPVVSYTCSNGNVSLNAGILGSDEVFRWYDAPSAGSIVSTANPYAPSLTHTTNYYVSRYNSVSLCESARVAVVATKQGLDAYTATRNTGITFSNIASTGTAVTSWRNGTSNGNLSNNVDIGFSFPFDGSNHTQLRVGLNGFITFNTSSNANGDALVACGNGDAYSGDNFNTFTRAGAKGSLQTIAPFYDNLVRNGTSTLNTTVHYQVTGTTPNRVLTVQWRNLSRAVSSNCSSPCSYGNYNFQVKLYEADGNIEFVYGTMTTGSDELSKRYSCGLNSASLATPLNTSKLFTQQTHNTATFSSNVVNNLSTVPETNTRILFTRYVSVASTAVPQCIAYNYPANGATAQCRNTLLSWNAVDGAPTGYDVYLSTNQSLVNSADASVRVSTNQNTPFYNPGTLNASATYYWKIVPRNGSGLAVAANMPVWSFGTSPGESVSSISSSAGTTFCRGTTTTLTVNGTRSEGSEYNWTSPFILDLGCKINPPFPLLSHIFDDNACSASSRTLTFNTPGTYIFDVFVKGCNSTSSCAYIIITVLDFDNIAPSSISSSNGTTICSGTSTTLTANGGTQGAGAQYEWFTGSTCGGTPFATTSTNTVTVSPTGNTTYRVRITGGNTCPNTTGCAVQTITVQNAISNNTISAAQTICNGTTPATILGSTPLGGNGTYTYSWQQSTTSASSGFSNISSTNVKDYTPDALSQTTWFRRRVTSGACTTQNISAAIQITVNAEATEGSIGSDQTICSGGAPAQLTSSSNGTGSGTISYQWQTNATGSYVNISGATSATYQPSALTATTSYRRRTVSVSGGITCYSNYTTPVTITIVAQPTATNPTVNRPTLCRGGTATFASTVSGGFGNATYQWEYSANGSSGWVAASNGTPSGITYGTPTAVSTTVIPANATSTPLGLYYYRLAVTYDGAGCNTAYSAAASVNVVADPVITNAQSSYSFCEGQPIEITSSSSGGTGSLAYQWQYNNAGTYGLVVNGTPIGTSYSYNSTVESNNTLSVTGLSVGTYQYRFRQNTNTLGCAVNGAQITVTVQPSVTIDAFSPSTSTRCQGAGTQTLTTTANNSTGISYSLDAASISGGNSINAATGEINFAANWTGNTTVTASAAGCNGLATTTYTINTGSLPNAAITNNSGTTELTCATTSISLTATGGISYSWNNGLGAGAAKSITVPGSFTVTVTSANGCTSSAILNITQNNTPPITFNVSGGGSVGCAGSGLDISLSGSENNVNYQLKLNGVNVGSPTAGTGNALVWSNQTASGVYTVEASNSGNCTANMSGSATITSSGLNITTINTNLTTHTIADNDVIWTGAGDINWNNAGNWLRYNASQTAFESMSVLPSSTQNIFILSQAVAGSCINATNTPEVPQGYTGNARNVYIGDAATLAIAGTIELTGDWINRGTFTHTGTGNRRVVFNGNANQSILTNWATGSNNNTFYDLVIDNTGSIATVSVKMADNINVLSKITVEKGKFDVDDKVGHTVKCELKNDANLNIGTNGELRVNE